MRLALIVLISILAGGAFGQAPAFEVASVKMAGGGAMPPSFSLSPRRSGGRFTWTTTLDYLVWYAYDLPDWQVSGLRSEMVFYTITATVNASATEADVRAMLRELLADRFQFAAHTKTEERSGYTLVIGPKGHKLTMKTQGEGFPPLPVYLAGKPPEAYEGRILTTVEGPGTSAITGRGVPLSKLAAEISKSVGTFVLDRTGLAGDYYFGFRFLYDDVAGANARDPNVMALPISNVLQDEVGLRLERTKGPVEILVVDRLQKVPTEN